MSPSLLDARIFANAPPTGLVPRGQHVRRTVARMERSDIREESPRISLRSMRATIYDPVHRPRSARELRRHLDLSAGAQELHRNLVAASAHQDVGAGIAELQVAQDDLAEKRRQSRIAQADLASRGIKLQPE